MVTVKQAYEWVKTGHWSLSQFKEWVISNNEAAVDAAREEDAYYHNTME